MRLEARFIQGKKGILLLNTALAYESTNIGQIDLCQSTRLSLHGPDVQHGKSKIRRIGSRWRLRPL
jgi:hypothetical protein